MTFDLKVEQNALSVGKWANLVMAFAGILAAWLSRSDAILVDGLYSGINFASAIAAAAIGRRVGAPPTRVRPWGHDFDEVLYVTFRNLILIGVLVFAVFISGNKIYIFLSGGEVPELVFGPIAVYAIFVALICLLLAFNFRRAYFKTGKKSKILKTEARAALVDGALSIGSGLALLSLTYLNGTPLEYYIPIGDAVIVLLLLVFIIWQPLAAFRETLSDLAAVSAPAKTVSPVARAARDLAREMNLKFHRAAVLQAGRMHYAAIYVDAIAPLTGVEVDAYRDKVSARLEDLIGPTRVEVVLTANAGPLPSHPT